MDPYYNNRDSRNLNSSRNTEEHPREKTPGTSGNYPDVPDNRNLPATDREPRHSDGFTMIPPNESRRSQLNMVAQKGLEILERSKEANRPSAVHLNPERLGGNLPIAEARQRQFTNAHCSKLQKKLRKEDLDKRTRQEEEEKLQKMKNEKRAMAERLEEKRRQEEQQRREHLRQDHLRTTEGFIQRLERSAPGPLASGSATHTSSRSEAVATEKRDKGFKSVREVQQEHQRVNSAFLDKLEGQGRGSEKERKDEVIQEAEFPCYAFEDFRHQLPNIPGQQVPITHLDPDPGQSSSYWTEEADLQPDYDWALMKLMNVFPDCSRVFLEDILDQCGDYDQAHALLMSTLS